MAMGNGCLTLDQRLQLEGWSLHERLSQAPAEALGTGKLEQWRQVVAPDQPSRFSKRLQWDGFTTDQAAWAVNPTIGPTSETPSWWPTLIKIRAAASAPSNSGLEERGSELPFVHAWRPVVSWALLNLQQRCADLTPALILGEGAWFDLAEALLERLCAITDQALWELFNQRRTPGQILLAHLGAKGDGNGEPVHEAYDALVAELLSDGYALLLSEYPVLGRLISQVTDLWLESSEEMLRRLADSRVSLVELFAIDMDAPLEAIQLGLSDPHRGGRAVAILSFDIGDQVRRVVYKPKDMQVDLVYQQFLQLINGASNLPPLRPLVVLSCPGYGFMEWVEHRICRTDAELDAFYTNAGRTMAVLHLLGCTDCHYENLIANGDQLVLIDTETLLEADLRDPISDDADGSDQASPLQSSMQGSVLRSGLLPQWQMVGAGRKRAFDISALGIQPPPPEREQAGWLGLNNDGMMAGTRTMPCKLPTSLPVGLGSPQRLTDFVDQLCAGFETQLQELIRLRSQVRQALDAFRGKPRRLVARNTRLYFTIQRQMLEPGALRSAVAHGLKLEQLSRSFVLASECPINWPMFQAELQQMQMLDIPFFEHSIDGEDLPLSGELGSIKGLIKSSGLSAAKRRLHELDTTEIAFQQQLMRGAIAARHLTGPIKSSFAQALNRPLGSASPPLAVELVGMEALRLAEQLWSSAIHDRNGRPEWLGMDLGADGESFHFGLIGYGLYSGTSGIALALSRISLGQPQFAAALWRARAWKCVEGLAQLAESNANDQLFRLVRDLPYGLSGTGGLLLALQLLGEAGINQATLLAELLIEQIRPERLLADEGVDLISGVTGLIGPLLRSDQPRGLELAAVCGERLLAVQQSDGGWFLQNNKRALTGLSHGAGGSAAALAVLAEATGERRYAEAAGRALAYERSVFLPTECNWPDFRTSGEADMTMTSWCHGAPGILLSRLVLQAVGAADECVVQEIDIARATTMAYLRQLISSGGLSTYASHLCCGAFGLTALLRLDADLCHQELPELVTEVERHLIETAQTSGTYKYLSFDTGSLRIPGLFTGQAGVILALQEAAGGLRWLAPVLSGGLLA